MTGNDAKRLQYLMSNIHWIALNYIVANLNKILFLIIIVIVSTNAKY